MIILYFLDLPVEMLIFFFFFFGGGGFLKKAKAESAQ